MARPSSQNHQMPRNLPASLQTMVSKFAIMVVLLNSMCHVGNTLNISKNATMLAVTPSDVLSHGVTTSMSWTLHKQQTSILSNSPDKQETSILSNSPDKQETSILSNSLLQPSDRISKSTLSPHIIPTSSSLVSIVRQTSKYFMASRPVPVSSILVPALPNRTEISSSLSGHTSKATASLYSSQEILPSTSVNKPPIQPSTFAKFLVTSRHLLSKTESLSTPVESSKTSSLPVLNYTSHIPTSASSVLYSPLSSVPICPGSSSCTTVLTKKSKDSLYMYLGVGVGAAFVFFVIAMAVAICMKKKNDRHASKYQRSGRHPPEKAFDQLLESKESVFNSSTLHLGGGVFNRGLEMEMNDSRICILQSTPKTNNEQEGSSSTFRPQQDTAPEPLTVHVSMEQVDRVPSGIQPSAMFGLNKELTHDVNIRLLQDWHNELNDSRSMEYQDLKSDVEESIKDIYKSKQGFKDARLECFRKGSVVANVSLVLLAMVKNPLEILEQCVSQGRVGNLSVDKHFSVARSKDEVDSSTDPYFDKRQPYMQRLLSKEGKRKSMEREDNASYTADPSSSEVTSDQETDDSMISLTPMETRSQDQPAYVNVQEAVARRSSLVEVNSDSVFTANDARPTSLVDLGRAEPIRFRDQRDSGIGSMQELNRVDSGRISRYENIPETSEPVIYDTPEGTDAAVPTQAAASNQFTSNELKSPAEQGVAHVALFDFDGNDNRELSVKQGELVYVSQKETLGWVKVVNSDNLRGWVPTPYLVQVSQSQLASTQQTVETLEFLDSVLEELDEESSSDLSSPPSTPKTEIYSEPADIENDNDDHDYLPLVANDNSDIQDKDKDNHEYLSLVADDNLVHWCKSLHAFTASDQSEMSFEEGEVITVLKTTATGWWKGRILTREGWFPASYVQTPEKQAEFPELKTWTEEEERTPDPNAKGDEGADNPSGYSGRDDVIYDEPETSASGFKEHDYQSLKQQFKPPENYANLYLQILKRESKSEEDLERQAAARQVKLKEADPERPLRVAPIPPREETQGKPAVPPRHSIQQPTTPQHTKPVKEKPLKKNQVTTHGEPPKRPVPPPPTAKPTIVSASIPTAPKKDGIIFSDKNKTKSPPDTKYENIAEDAEHSVVTVPFKDGGVLPEKDTAKAAITSHINTARPFAPPSKPLPATCKREPDFTTSKTNDKSNEIDEQSSSPQKPSKPLPTFQTCNTTENHSMQMPVPHSEEIASSSSITSSQGNEAKASRPLLPKKPSIDLPSTSPKPKSPAKSESAGPNEPISVVTDTPSPSKPVVLKKPVKPLRKPAKTDCVSPVETENTKQEPSEEDVTTRPGEKTAPKTNPDTSPKAKARGFVINKEELLASKAVIDHNRSSKNQDDSVKPSLRLSDLIKGKDKKAPPKVQRPASKPILAQKSLSVTDEIEAARKPDTVCSEKNDPKEKNLLAEGAKQNIKSVLSEHKKSPVRPSTPPAPVKSSKPSLSSPDSNEESTKAANNNEQKTKTDSVQTGRVLIKTKPTLPVKPSITVPSSRTDTKESLPSATSSATPKTAHLIDNKAEDQIKTSSPSGRLGPPKKSLSETSSESSAGKNIQVPIPVKRVVKKSSGDADPKGINALPTEHNTSSVNKLERSTDTTDGSSPNAPIPAPRPKTRTAHETQNVGTKKKPDRPSSPPVQETEKKDKPGRPPPPSVKSPNLTSPQRKAKDKSRLRRVIKSYSKTSEKELDLLVGATIFELASEGSNCYGLLENGKEGWYPADHVVAVEQDR